MLKANAHSEEVSAGGSVRNNGAVVTLDSILITDAGACNGGGVSSHGGSLDLLNMTFRLNDSFTPATVACDEQRWGSLRRRRVTHSRGLFYLRQRCGGRRWSNLSLVGICRRLDKRVLQQQCSWVGGAVGVDAGTITISGSTFQDDLAENYGGAVFQDGGQLTVENSTLSENFAGTSDIEGSGGALFTGEPRRFPTSRPLTTAQRVRRWTGF